MDSWPRVGIVIFTVEPLGAPRATAGRVLLAVLEHLRYSGELQVHIADDGSEEPGHVEALRLIAGCDARVVAVTSSNAERGGYGRSFNLSTIFTHDACPILLNLEDDWLLTRDLDLDPLVETLCEPVQDGGFNVPIESIRLGYVGWTAELRGRFIATPAGKMLYLDPESPETHVVSFGPRLNTREYERAAGVWPEGVSPGICEMTMARVPAAREGVAWPLDYGPASMREDSLFAHIGTFSTNVWNEEQHK